MHAMARELYPLCRSLTGDGVRETLRILGRHIPIEVTEVPTGEPIFDWTAPKEWNIREAWIADPQGRRVVDFRNSNLHVLGYSVPVRARMSLGELREHLYAEPERPDVVPYRTSYWTERWGFCISQRQLDGLVDGEYEVVIDSTVEDGTMTYGECVVEAPDAEAEVLVSTYVCHPSLANDNLSGIVVAAALARQLQGAPLRSTYRFLFGPGTVGPIAWLAANEHNVGRIRNGLVLSCLGDPAPFTYKRSRRGDAEVDQAAPLVLGRMPAGGRAVEFEPWGGDERQFCSPGFDLPVGVLMRSPPGEYPEYHSSADDLELVRAETLEESLAAALAIVEALETNAWFRNLNPKCEPQLGRRGLYRSIGGGASAEQALLWVLNLSDGRHSLLDMAERSGLTIREVGDAAAALADVGLLEELSRPQLGRGGA
jgi:aminopeptidase-like protein